MADAVKSRVVNALSIDVEEYFHPTELAESVRPEEWQHLPSLVESQTMVVLEMFAQHGISATFFILGWVAERKPQIVREITRAGHEVGCHSHLHSLVYNLTPSQFREDTLRSMRAIEDACGVATRAYRAPSYSITARSLWALDILIELGFTHDSSIYPIRHDRYGIPGFGRGSQHWITPSGTILEVPIATAALSHNRIIPVGGGGYLRLLPYHYTAAGLRYVNQVEGTPACVYFHPWELDPGQPRFCSGTLSRWRTYAGLKGMRSKINRLLKDFAFAPLTQVYPHGTDAIDSGPRQVSASVEPANSRRT
jgi:polysaccharide deacetylase family protein (PEP-CTERM system associated)